MSRRKSRGLDYTARPFPGARAPDGPAPDLEAKLIKLGLVDQTVAKEPIPDGKTAASPLPLVPPEAAPRPTRA